MRFPINSKTKKMYIPWDYEGIVEERFKDLLREKSPEAPKVTKKKGK